MSKFLNTPLFLLLGTGLSLGLLMPFGKLAHDAAIDPFLWATMIALVPGLMLTIIAFRKAIVVSGLLPFGITSGIFAYVIPNATLFLAMPHIGSGLAGLMFALSPVMTAAMSALFGVRPPSRGLLVAVALGFAGASIIGLGRNSLALPSAPTWFLIALIIPVSLAIGNVYRTAKWPTGATALQVGAASNLAAAPLLLLATWWRSGTIDLGPLLANPGLAICQCLTSVLMFSLFFRLQWVGGPTYLSQIGYIAAAVSLSLGVFLFGEIYPWAVWLGAGFILVGIAASLLEPNASTTK